MKCSSAKLLSPLRHLVAPIDDKDHVRSEHEGNPVPAESTELLGVTQELAKVYVEEVAGGLHLHQASRE